MPKWQGMWNIKVTLDNLKFMQLYNPKVLKKKKPITLTTTNKNTST